ncbi:unnamed protein product [Merluccius merluccius]
MFGPRGNTARFTFSLHPFISLHHLQCHRNPFQATDFCVAIDSGSANRGATQARPHKNGKCFNAGRFQKQTNTDGAIFVSGSSRNRKEDKESQKKNKKKKKKAKKEKKKEKKERSGADGLDIIETFVACGGNMWSLLRCLP